jgi:multiple sugar transport system permease protein
MFRRIKDKNIRDDQIVYHSLRDSSIIRLFVLPVIILLVAINVFPLFWSLILSFSNYSAKMVTEWGKNPEMVGVVNYSKILTDPDMWYKFITTAKYVLLSVSGEMILGFGLALLLQLKFKGRELITTFLILPMTMSPVIVGLMWKLFYNPNWAKYLYEAAEIDRASWWSKFRRITLPMVYPILLVALIFRTMEAFKIFDLPMGITGRGAMAPQLIAMHLYNVSFVTWKTSYGSAIGYIILIVIIAITSIFIKYLNKAKQ